MAENPGICGSFLLSKYLSDYFICIHNCGGICGGDCGGTLVVINIPIEYGLYFMTTHLPFFLAPSRQILFFTLSPFSAQLTADLVNPNREIIFQQ